MQLKDLSQRTGISPASIKYYLREGLLSPGESIHATRARYDEKHVKRLELIHSLRHIVLLTIEQIRGILAMADAGAPHLEVLAQVQRTVLGLPAKAGHKPARTTQADAVVRMRNWPDVDTDARDALDVQIALMERLHISLPVELLDAYSQAVDSIAGLDLRLTTATDDVDDVILTAAVGMHLHSELILKMLALAQASHAIKRFESGH